MESATTPRSPAWEIFGEFDGHQRETEAASMRNIAALWETIQKVNWRKIQKVDLPLGLPDVIT